MIQGCDRLSDLRDLRVCQFSACFVGPQYPYLSKAAGFPALLDYRATCWNQEEDESVRGVRNVVRRSHGFSRWRPVLTQILGLETLEHPLLLKIKSLLESTECLFPELTEKNALRYRS